MQQVYQSKSAGQTGYQSRCATISSSMDIDNAHSKKQNLSQSEVFQLGKNSKEQIQAGGVAVKLGPKIPNYNVNESFNAHRFKFDVQTRDIDLSDQVQIMHESDAKSIKKPFKNSDTSQSLHQANLVVSSIISWVYVFHIAYWEYIRENHTSHKVHHTFEMTIALCLLNLVPSMAIMMDIYSVVLSAAVFMHILWMTYHTLTVWTVELCYGAIDDGCNAVQMYKNITLCLQAVIVCHQVLLMITGIYQNKLKKETERIASILHKASNLNISSDVEDISAKTHVGQHNHHDAKVLNLYPIDQNIRDTGVGIYSEDPTFTTGTITSIIAGDEKISESAAEELEMDDIIQRNQAREFVGSQTAPIKVLKARKTSNKIFASSTDKVDEDDSMDSDSTFEMYGVGSPKDTHGKKLRRPSGLHVDTIETV